MRKYKVKINNESYVFSYMDHEKDCENTLYINYDSKKKNGVFYIIQLIIEKDQPIDYLIGQYIKDNETGWYEAEWSTAEMYATEKEVLHLNNIVKLMYKEYLKVEALNNEK